jgi:TonB family protein
MSKHWLAVPVSVLLLSAPLPANTPAETSVRQSANGEFLFKHYPPRALAAREQGKVGFRVTLTSDGSLTSCEVTKSSGYASLDSETCELISTYGHFQPVRNADGRGVAAIHEGIVNWTLPPNAPETAKVRMASSTTGRDPDKIICRRDVATGSLVSTVKRCMTRREWGRASDQAQEEVARVQGKGMAWDGD